jgi:dihydrolipoamide dehydrogenase
MTSSSVEKLILRCRCKAFVKQPKEKYLEADMLSAVGIKTNIENIGLEEVGIATDKDKILVNAYNAKIFQDTTQLVMLRRTSIAHVASAEGINCVEKIAGMHVEPIDYGNVPGCTYIHLKLLL